MKARGTSRCFLSAAVPKLVGLDVSVCGYPTSLQLATASRGVPIVSDITPRPHPIFAGTTTRCICHSVSRLVVGSRTLSINACKLAADQQFVAVTPAGTATLV